MDMNIIERYTRKKKYKLEFPKVYRVMWIYFVTRLDEIRNEFLRGSLGVMYRAEIMRENEVPTLSRRWVK